MYLRTGERRQSSESAGIEAAREGEKGKQNIAAGQREGVGEGAVAPFGFDPHGILILVLGPILNLN